MAVLVIYKQGVENPVPLHLEQKTQSLCVWRDGSLPLQARAGVVSAGGSALTPSVIRQTAGRVPCSCESTDFSLTLNRNRFFALFHCGFLGC